MFCIFWIFEFFFSLFSRGSQLYWGGGAIIWTIRVIAPLTIAPPFCKISWNISRKIFFSKKVVKKSLSSKKFPLFFAYRIFFTAEFSHFLRTRKKHFFFEDKKKTFFLFFTKTKNLVELNNYPCKMWRIFFVQGGTYWVFSIYIRYNYCQTFLVRLFFIYKKWKFFFTPPQMIKTMPPKGNSFFPVKNSVLGKKLSPFWGMFFFVWGGGEGGGGKNKFPLYDIFLLRVVALHKLLPMFLVLLF